MARPKTDDPEARAHILAAAEELFAARGFAGTSIRDIARRAGVTGAMLHYYFGSKEALYTTLLEKAVAGIRSLIAETAASQKPAPERLRQFIEADAGYILTHANLTRIVFREMLAGGKELVKVFQKYRVNNYAMLRGIITEGAQRAELRQIDLELAPISLMGMLMVFQVFRPVIAVALNKPVYDEAFIQRVAAHTADLFLNGALNQAGAGTRAPRKTASQAPEKAAKAQPAGGKPVKPKPLKKAVRKVKP
jgi:TetR/AcrR family transcriptional regulator